ncbi:hypothetical protein [Duganella callida]|uniref:FecR protein domain-containing protein n=1 Tax=Duganella callida TaxID=2561932 RepID=A0A4Y9SCF3_9BURK|nr:hypothetical protein [Duganella callida]TFW20086.1 hypothetical protein E4L98_15260 [Duganella callida]
MHRPFSFAAGLLTLMATVLPAPASAQTALLSHAERPARLIRKTTVYDAPAGVRLLPGDIVESGASGLQIEWPNGAVLALGPSSSVQLDGPASPTVLLLRGWLKLAATKPANSQLAASAGPWQLKADHGSAILHLAGTKTELFVEQGPLPLTETDRPGATGPTAVGRDQYAVRNGEQALQVSQRAPRQFVSEMPRTFYDPLVTIASRIRPADPAALREIEVQDLASWNDVPPLLRKRMVAQFTPRLNDAAFRQNVEAQLGDDPDWRQALQKTVKKRPPGMSNYLF